MKLLVEKLPDLRALYVNQLRLALSAEEQLSNGVKRMIESAHDSELKSALESKISEITTRTKRVEGLVSQATGNTDSVKCKAMSALIDEAEDTIHEAADTAVRDAGLIGAAQKICHYQIATYGTARQFAHALALQADMQILDELVRELSTTNQSLTTIAEKLNLAAVRAAY
jgi:ferritin-like metal-binding protein YciE